MDHSASTSQTHSISNHIISTQPQPQQKVFTHGTQMAFLPPTEDVHDKGRKYVQESNAEWKSRPLAQAGEKIGHGCSCTSGILINVASCLENQGIADAALGINIMGVCLCAGSACDATRQYVSDAQPRPSTKDLVKKCMHPIAGTAMVVGMGLAVGTNVPYLPIIMKLISPIAGSVYCYWGGIKDLYNYARSSRPGAEPSKAHSARSEQSMEERLEQISTAQQMVFESIQPTCRIGDETTKREALGENSSINPSIAEFPQVHQSR